jgi:uncharacterized membrane protein
LGGASGRIVRVNVDPEDDEAGWPHVPRSVVALAIGGWLGVSALAYGVARLAGWTALTEGRPWILLLVGAPYWYTVIFLLNRIDRRRQDPNRS